MKRYLLLLRLFLFWILLFAMFRAAFAVVYHGELTAGSAAESLHAFIVGIRMDSSAASYLLVVPFLLQLIIVSLETKPVSTQYSRSFLTRLFHVYHGTVIGAITLVSVINFKVYAHLGELLNSRMFAYLLFPGESVASLSKPTLIYLACICAATIYVLYRIYFQVAGRHLGQHTNHKATSAKINPLYLLLYAPLIITGLRGGIQPTPMNESMCYFSTCQAENILASNGAWVMGFSFVHRDEASNPYVTMPEPEAVKTKQIMMSRGEGTAVKLLNTERPNIVIVMLESWTADVIERLGGVPRITPNFERLRQNGLLFTNAYASGSRTDHGIISIISGFPAQPNHSIIMQPDKAKKLPAITKSLHDSGYHTSFYYGGDADFADMKAFLLNAQFDRIIEGGSFKNTTNNGKWGANDEYVYKKQLDDMNRAVQPFFSLVLTLSSHEPYDVPTHRSFKGKNDEASNFMKGIFYSDSCLEAYLNDAGKEKWFNNTLFILVADHGHRLPLLRTIYSPEAHHITMMFYGAALKDEFRGKELDKAVSQCDIAAMICGQLHLADSSFKWSKDAIDQSVKDFACYINDQQGGIVAGKQHLTYLLSTGAITSYSQGAISADSLKKCAECWLQLYYQQYLNY